MKLEELSEKIKKQLNAQITKEEIEEAIINLKTDKTLGPDGFSAKFYKLFKGEITEILQEFMNEILGTREIPHTWQDANILLIPKEALDLKDPKNYRPISLLNLDYKLFTKILAGRLKKKSYKFY